MKHVQRNLESWTLSKRVGGRGMLLHPNGGQRSSSGGRHRTEGVDVRMYLCTVEERSHLVSADYTKGTYERDDQLHAVEQTGVVQRR